MDQTNFHSNNNNNNNYSSNSINNNNNVGDILMEGLVTKSPPFERMKKLVSWHTRYMVLVKIHRQNLGQMEAKKGGSLKKKEENIVHYCLAYWESENDRKKGEKPIRTMVLLKSHSTVIQPSPYFADKFEHVFALVTPERVFYFNTDNESKRQQWFTTINQAVQSSAVDETDDDHIYQSIMEVLKMKKHFRRGSQASMKSSNSLPRRDSSESKDSCSISGDDDSNVDSYVKMFSPHKWKRSLSALQKQRPTREKLRKASVPLPPSPSTFFIGQTAENSLQKTVSQKTKRRSIAVMSPVNIDTVREIEFTSQRKSGVFTLHDMNGNQHSPILKPPTPSTPSSSTTTTTITTDGTFVAQNDYDEKNNNEPVYYELEDLEIDEITRSPSSVSSVEKEKRHSYKNDDGDLTQNDGIEFYDVNIRVPNENVRIKMSEQHLTIQTNKVLCTLRHLNSYKK